MYVTLDITTCLASLCYKRYCLRYVKSQKGGRGWSLHTWLYPAKYTSLAFEIENMAEKGCYGVGVDVVGAIRF